MILVAIVFLLLLLGGALVIVRILQMLALLMVVALVAASVWLVYLFLAIFGISLAGFYQVFGAGNFGWAAASAGAVMLLSAYLLLRAIRREIVTTPRRLGGLFKRQAKN